VAEPTFNKVRIVGGLWRSRVLHFAPSPGLRPSPDRVRETLFNWLGQDLTGRTCLDLFAGSGALGFEAASRGAARVVLVERVRAVHAALVDNARLLGGDALQVVQGDALQFLASNGDARYDIVFVDPPFDSTLLAKVMPPVAQRLNPDGRVYVESPRAQAYQPPAGWHAVKAATAGAVHYQLLERADNEP
jgi:16S rRNA (guanine966-N2)-methyltransferase